jgi:hypothetical protein
MGGTSTDGNGILFLHSDDFYDGDGCYTFEVKVTNTFYEETAVVTESRMSWELQFDKYNDNDGGQDARTYDTC